MDANELAMIAYDVMPGGIMTEAGKGEMFGVLKMALRSLEAQYTALLADADEEAAEAKKLWREALSEMEAMKVMADSFANMRQGRNKLSQQCDDMAAELDAKQRELDGLQAENARLHRSLEERMTVRIPGAVQVANTEELHGMADVYAQSQRMSNVVTPSKPVHLVLAGSEDL